MRGGGARVWGYTYIQVYVYSRPFWLERFPAPATLFFFSVFPIMASWAVDWEDAVELVRGILAAEAAAPAESAASCAEPADDVAVIQAILAREAADQAAPPGDVAEAGGALEADDADGCGVGAEDVRGFAAGADGDEEFRVVAGDSGDGEGDGMRGGDPDAGGGAVDAGGVDAGSAVGSEEEDWAFELPEAEVAALSPEKRARLDRVVAICRARDFVSAAAALQARPVHGRLSDAEFAMAQAPTHATRAVGERGRRLLGIGKKTSTQCDPVDLAVELALSWTHKGSFHDVHGGLSTEEGVQAAAKLRQRVATFEPEGISQRLRYFKRFSDWLAEHGSSSPGAATALETRRFFSSLCTPIPSLPRSIWISISWINRVLLGDVALPLDAKPTAGAMAGAAEDARVPPAPPELVRRVDWLLRDAIAAKSESTTLLAGVMTMTLSWLRFRHIQRAIPTSLSRHVLWIMVAKSKRPDSTGVRRGFRIGIPRVTPNGADVGQLLWGMWNKQAETSGVAAPGLLRDSAGALISLRAFNTGVQRLIANERLTDTPQLVTSYSWRRGTDAMGEARGVEPHELAAMGAWKPAAGAGTASHPSTPLRYAGDRLAGAAAARIVHVKVLRSVFVRCPSQTALSWERFRREVGELDQDLIRREVADMLLDDPVSAELKDGVIPGVAPRRRIEVSARPDPMGDEQRKKESKKKQTKGKKVKHETPGHASSDAPSTRRAWVIPKSPAAKVHFSTVESAGSQSPTWLCSQAVKEKFRDADYRGDQLEEGLTACLLLKRRVCDSCISYLDEPTAEWVRRRLSC